VSTQQISARRFSRLATVVFAPLALTAAVLAVAIQACSITSTRIDPQVPRVPAAIAVTATPAPRTSGHDSERCWRRKFGCGHGATTTAKHPERVP
jgi:hypothetical protein